MKYSPSDILRKFVLRQCIEHLVQTSDHAVWFNVTFWECVTKKDYAIKRWDKLRKALIAKYPDFRFVGVWARQRRGAWHIHGVCNHRFELSWFRDTIMRCGFGPQHYLREIDGNEKSPEKIARYISGYCTDKNGLDAEKDKGVRRTIFIGKYVKVVDMRYRSWLKRITSAGREIASGMREDQDREMTEFQREFAFDDGRKLASETWGEWYKRNRGYWFQLGWYDMTKEEREEIEELDEFVRRYLERGYWSFV